jgi:hypothetical protein
METDEQPLKVIAKISRYSYIRLKALLMISAAALFIATCWAFYHHHHYYHPIDRSVSGVLRFNCIHDLIDHYHHPHHHSPLIVKIIAEDLQSITTNDLSTSASANIPSTERQALQNLYESTNGAHWKYGSSSAGIHWSFEVPDINPCTEGWYGVQCIDNRITGLSLAGRKLIGTIPESLSQLNMLMHLDLGDNLLIGRVPTTLCQIKSLVRVDLEGTSIACYPDCLDHAAVIVKVHPSIPVCSNIQSRYSPSVSSIDSSSSSALVKSPSNSNTHPLEHQKAVQDLYNSTDVPKLNFAHGNIPSAERQALQGLYESIDGSSSAGNHWSFDDPDVAKNHIDLVANQAVSHEKGM